MKKHMLRWLLVLAVLLPCMVVGTAAEEPYALNRGNLCMLIADKMGLYNCDTSNLTESFSDVSPEDEYYSAVLILSNMGIVSGYGGGVFKPNDIVTREQLAVILRNLNGNPQADAVDWSTYAQVQMSEWAEDAVRWAVSTGVMWADENNCLLMTTQAYSDDADFSCISHLKVVADTMQMDISAGSISITANAFFSEVTQNGGSVRTTGNIIVRQRDTSIPTGNTITVSGGEVNMTLAGVNIASDSASPISVASGAHLVLNLLGVNTLTTTGDCVAGLKVPEGAQLTIEGTGVLTAKGGLYGAGIGGANASCGDITVVGGTIYATGGKYAPGIGGKDGESISISGGNVTATGGINSAGIGGGSWSGTINITGGKVKAIGNGGAGIGGGHTGKGGTVTIRDAEVSASGYYHAIGGGSLDNEDGCDSITISNSILELSYEDPAGADCQERIFVDLEPKDSAALVGGRLTMTAKARGNSGVGYRWWYSKDEETWKDVIFIDGTGRETLSVPMTQDLSGVYFRCRISNGFGNDIYTESAQAYVLAFAQQPTPVEVNVGDYASLIAKSTCANVTYHWERSYDNGVSWNAVPGETYATLLVNVTLSESGSLYRCVITATNGDQLASDAVPITVDTDDVTYTVKYYHQLPDGSGYGVAEQAVLVGVPNGSVTAPTKTFDGFAENAAKGIHSGAVAADGSLVLSRYYDRNEYSITFDMKGGSALSAITARYGAAVAAPADPVRYGYDFGGWYADAALTTPYTFATMPLNGATVYAKWVSKDEGRGTEYQINGILFRDEKTYEPVDTIPKGDFLAEVSVTNLSSTQMDTVLFVSYGKGGQMLGFHYAFANPNIGQTMTFGTAIDNQNGQVATVKVMVLSSLSGMRPLAQPVSR